MNDEPDLELEAASAAVDGLATTDERALVEASPALQADVERFTAISGRIKDVVVPPSARGSALAAALAEFDDLAAADDAPAAAAATATGTTAPVVSLTDRRRRQYRVLLGAAAAVAVLGVGAVALNSLSGGTDEDSASVATAGASTFIESSPAETSAQTERDEDPASEKTEGAADAEVADVATELPAPAAPAEAGETVADSTPLVINDSAEVTPSIESPEELLAYATTGLVTGAPSPDATVAATEDTAASDTTTVEAPDTTSPLLDPLSDCLAADTDAADTNEYVGAVMYQGAPAHVVRVVRTGEIRALSTADCRLIVSATP